MPQVKKKKTQYKTTYYNQKPNPPQKNSVRYKSFMNLQKEIKKKYNESLRSILNRLVTVFYFLHFLLCINKVYLYLCMIVNAIHYAHTMPIILEGDSALATIVLWVI